LYLVSSITSLKSSRERQQSHIPGAFYRPFGLSLAACTVSAALTRVYLTAIGQKFLQGPDVFVVNIFYASSAKTALCLITGTNKTRLSSVISFILHSLPHTTQSFLLFTYYYKELEHLFLTAR
jgi:hypothetical protein